MRKTIVRALKNGETKGLRFKLSNLVKACYVLEYVLEEVWEEDGVKVIRTNGNTFNKDLIDDINQVAIFNVIDENYRKIISRFEWGDGYGIDKLYLQRQKHEIEYTCGIDYRDYIDEVDEDHYHIEYKSFHSSEWPRNLLIPKSVVDPQGNIQLEWAKQQRKFPIHSKHTTSEQKLFQGYERLKYLQLRGEDTTEQEERIVHLKKENEERKQKTLARIIKKEEEQ